VLKMFESDSGLGQLSVGELKALLSERGIDFRDCLEKRDLVERLQSTKPSASAFKPMASGFTESETRTVSVFKSVSPAVAYIQTVQLAPQSLFSLRPMEYPSGSGSGFLWDEDGHIVTNYHVLAGAGGSGALPSKVKVSLQGLAEPIEAQLVGGEADKDLAVLKVDRSALPAGIKPLQVGVSSELAVGQSVLAIGNPFGLDYTLTTGVVSALGREVRAAGGGQPIQDCVQTDAAINPGNSGGPLLDSNGKLIGVNTAIYSPSGGGNVGIGFAIPVDTVRRVVNQILRYGSGARPTLGINLLNDGTRKQAARTFRRKLDGALITEVLPNSPAAAAGLQPTTRSRMGQLQWGDLIVAVDGAPVRANEDLACAVEEAAPGQLLELTVLRGQEQRRATVRVRPVARKTVRNAAGSPGRYRAPFNGVGRGGVGGARSGWRRGG